MTITQRIGYWLGSVLRIADGILILVTLGLIPPHWLFMNMVESWVLSKYQGPMEEVRKTPCLDLGLEHTYIQWMNSFSGKQALKLNSLFKNEQALIMADMYNVAAERIKRFD